jgi:hypothetical protein
MRTGAKFIIYKKRLIMKLNIIDTSSTEYNRGSFCYAPYLLYNGLTEIKEEVFFMEAFQPEDLDKIPDAEFQIVTLWSYPQIECAILLAQMLPFQFGKDNVYFIGYSPLIKELGLRNCEEFLGFDPLQDPDFLRSAMRAYPKNYKNFYRLLLSDCDMHLKHLNKGEKVYPLFTSYGCSNGCAFCPSTKNCGKTRIEVSIDETIQMLEECYKLGVRNIHFTDEDFFFDTKRAGEILNYIREALPDMHLIALGSAKAVWDFIQKYGDHIISDAGLEVIEIGFESGSEDLSQSMGVGKSLSDCQKLADIQDRLPFNIFWLVQTFFPGENIKSLNDTGKFMMKYGFKMNEVVGRLRTNGTQGGLGQFFQGYIGTPIFKTMRAKGYFITERPIRLIPSYLPNTFLEDTITEIHPEYFDAAVLYLELYNINTCGFNPDSLKIGSKIKDYITEAPMYQQIKYAIGLAILARFGVIK